ncbi:sensor histidine kinase [Actinacidiphila sp. ITFR-21]|uniref:sensor histidine kinase n=1 Tax=Actinacidiphila sp. ITFR-21 TaxID=3075199 RepID=UPI00288AA2F8|nr:ATP-binding protein [Streptomyces sp. ITFR-21]WNI16737.1 ATP-binding protein [Streptomyces sp. ITFR-21]
MSAQSSPLSVPPSDRRPARTAWTVVFPLAVVAAAGAACVWAAARVSTVDRPFVTVTGGAGAVLLGVAVALAMSRHRLRRELRFRTAELQAEAAREAERYTEAARLAAIDLEAAQRSARATEVQRRTAAEAQLSLRAALKSETTRAAALEGETARLAEVTIPLAVDRLRAGGSADTVLSRLPQPTGPAHQRLLGVLVQEIAASERMRAAGMAACASAAGRLQALTTGMLADLREMEDRLGEDVLGDLLHLDHCTAQAGRLADSVAVLTGARSGRRWTKPIVMESVLRGAMGRIDAYQRVRLHSTSTAAVAGYAAEGVMHALAELMDNACNFSPPTEEVHVYVQETHSGVVVTIEDAGLVMPDATLVRAQKLVSGEPLDLRSLSGTRLGLAVVGCLARKHGLLISFRPSSRGGTGVVVLIPPKILTRSPAEQAADYPAEDGGYGDGGYQGKAPYQGGAGYQAAGGYQPEGGAEFAGGRMAQGDPQGAAGHARPGQGHQGGPGGRSAAVPLPKRARGQTLAAAQHGDLTADPVAAWLDPSPEEAARAARSRAGAGARFSAFRDAAAGRKPPQARPGTHEEGALPARGPDGEGSGASGSQGSSLAGSQGNVQGGLHDGADSGGQGGGTPGVAFGGRPAGTRPYPSRVETADTGYLTDADYAADYPADDELPAGSRGRDTFGGFSGFGGFAPGGGGYGDFGGEDGGAGNTVPTGPPPGGDSDR